MSVYPTDISVLFQALDGHENCCYEDQSKGRIDYQHSEKLCLETHVYKPQSFGSVYFFDFLLESDLFLGFSLFVFKIFMIYC